MSAEYLKYCSQLMSLALSGSLAVFLDSRHAGIVAFGEARRGKMKVVTIFDRPLHLNGCPWPMSAY